MAWTNATELTYIYRSAPLERSQLNALSVYRSVPSPKPSSTPPCGAAGPGCASWLSRRAVSICTADGGTCCCITGCGCGDPSSPGSSSAPSASLAIRRSRRKSIATGLAVSATAGCPASPPVAATEWPFGLLLPLLCLKRSSSSAADGAAGVGGTLSDSYAKNTGPVLGMAWSRTATSGL